MSEGSEVTLVSVMQGVHDCLAAAELLAGDWIDAEVIDLQSLRPVDHETVIGSLERTNRLVCVEEGPRTADGPRASSERSQCARSTSWMISK